jgi:hypothetical protein
MYLVRLLLAFSLLSVLTGCYTLMPYEVPPEMSPESGSSEVGYLVGTFGVSESSVGKPDYQSLSFKSSEYKVYGYLKYQDNFVYKTQKNLDTDSYSYFAVPLKPGEYSLTHVGFSVSRVRSWNKQPMNVQFNVESGRAYYLGDIRSYCSVDGGALCRYLRSVDMGKHADNLKKIYPFLVGVDIDVVELKSLDSARPFILDLKSLRASGD